MAKSFLISLPPGDVKEGGDGTNRFPVSEYRVRPVLGGEARAVFSPENFVVYVGTFSLSKRLVNAALSNRIRRAVRSRMVHKRMHVVFQQVGRTSIPEQACASMVA